jgi:succinate-semialdehyde dehydrogenase/glutarate-semialdehyde dehydrogenase
MAIASINPSTGETVKEFSAIAPREVEEKLAAAERAFRSYRKTSFTRPICSRKIRRGSRGS